MAPGNTLTVDNAALVRQWELPDRGKAGMAMLILTESVLFLMFAAAYLVYLNRSTVGPYPQDVLHTPVLATVCLLSSSLTMLRAEHALKANKLTSYKAWWSVTILLAGVFLSWTALEWQRLIHHDHLTINTNLFGTTFYSLVGLHASHVTVGLILLIVFLISALLHAPAPSQRRRVTLLAWYWHFVDAVWVVVFSVVYVLGR
jgi:cytochrome c oxidase subunit III